MECVDDEIWKELLDGQLVDMPHRSSLRQIMTTGNLYCIFANHLRGKSCRTIPGRMDLILNEKDRFIPDMMVVRDREIIRDDGVYGIPALVVEVLSPGTVQRDRGYKKDAYESAGVPEYWIVDPLLQTVEVYQMENGRYSLNGVYARYRAEVLEMITDKEAKALPEAFRCTLFGDLNISLEDIFE